MKKVINSIYVHISAIRTLTPCQQAQISNLSKSVPADFQYHVIKLNTEDNSISFIQSLDFDSSNEPTVGDAYKVHNNGSLKFIKSKGQIYHHKWQFVESDYDGFDVGKSMERSKIWMNKIPQTKDIKCRIGYRKYWEELLKSVGLT